MAKNDMDVIIYKILSYMYECTKAGKSPILEDMCWDCQMFKIPQSYWGQILIELIEAGYVRGFLYRKTKDGILINMTSSTAITLSGVHFLAENSRMAKAKQFLGNAFEIVLSTIIGNL